MLLVFERRILRRIFGPVCDAEPGEWRTRHNAELIELSSLPPITSYISSQRLRWAGRLARLPDGSLVKEGARGTGTPFGRRPPGRPRMRWSDNVVADLTSLGVQDPEDWWSLAQDRLQWRLLVQAAKDSMGLQLRE